MNVNRVADQRNYGKTADALNPKKNRKTNHTNGGGFYESLSGNMYGQAAGQGEKETAGVQKQKNTTIGRNTTVHTSYQYQSVTSTIVLQSNGRIHADAVIECAARNISYAESDYVKTYVEQGFALKAKVDITAHAIYVEQKYEDGTVKGYEVDYGKLDENTENPVEQIALEAWEMARRAMMGDAPFHEVHPEELLPDTAANEAEEGEDKEGEEKKDLTDMTVEEALAEFYDFIQDRIKNGPPKYLIGASEFSVEEWEKMLDGVDGELDEIREEMRERIEKLKEQALQNDLEKEEAEGFLWQLQE
ncbi:MAG: hypothetical protein PUD93_12485 [Lachnospiraceae bacterium]|nr:hypothetical protein [Lachnospiraceae bacterium]